MLLSLPGLIIYRRGPFLGNSAAAIALTYNCFNSTIGYYRGKHDAVNSLSAGALSGMLFKSTKGIRPMLTSGAMVATAAGVWTVRCSSFLEAYTLLTRSRLHGKLCSEMTVLCALMSVLACCDSYQYIIYDICKALGFLNIVSVLFGAPATKFTKRVCAACVRAAW